MAYFDGLWLSRLLFQRGLAVIYLVAFLGAFNQFEALLGENGLLPVPSYLKRVGFRGAPSLFHWHYSDRLARIVAGSGIVLSLLALFGISDSGPLLLSMTIWLLLWCLYLSIVNVGQTFYGFGWESMLLEAGFFAAFLGPTQVEPSLIPILILRWMLFRVEIGSGLIKLRNDPCWRDLTCLDYHYETQPLPGPLSWYFHRLPKLMHRVSALFSHFVQLIVPLGLFAPQPWAMVSGGLIIFHQLWLIISGNYSWLNWLTVVLGFAAFSDLTPVHQLMNRPFAFDVLLYLLAGFTVYLSIKPVLNLCSKHQLMNFSYNQCHLVGTYGAFGDVTKERYEIVIEGTDAPTVDDHTVWKEYEFKGKPGPLKRRPPQVAPYHLRLDWMIWFLPFSVTVTDEGLIMPGHNRWFLRLAQKLLEGDAKLLKLFKRNPFTDKPPTYVRALFFRYQYTSWKERKETGAYWKRRLVGEYLSPARLAD